MGVAREAAGRNADAARSSTWKPCSSTRTIQWPTTTWATCASRTDASRTRGVITSAPSSRGPTNAEAHNNLGAVLLGSGNAAEALVRLEVAVRLRPAYPEAHFNRARAYALLRRFDEAIQAATIADEQAASAGKTALMAQIREQLRVYREGRRQE